jgi:hypoxanthine phosphoribosyltransferase
MTQPRPEVLFDETQIARRIDELGREIGGAFAGSDLAVVGLMKSCLIFMADLVRRIPLDLTCHFLETSSLREQGAGSGSMRTAIVYSTEIPYEGRDILLLDDVIDTGITLSFLLDHIRERRPRSLKVCALIDKPGDRKIDVHPDWAAFTLKESLKDGRFIVGYGLDYAEGYRGLPYLGTIPRPAPVAEGRKITISGGGS